MLCDFVEDGEPKCVEYFPLIAGETVRYGDLVIKNEKDEEPIQSITCQKITVQME
ncbi:unnamed protein product [Gongylonema pulchrum]|uniref:Tyrosine-protein phosphatase domain-containing protein n=1 Tax=Gongylonema pulchrum TaxID=637853 RepID=A0A183D815_9BILA|nr:unnamed protein product [Gongylonema pulchrum]